MQRFQLVPEVELEPVLNSLDAAIERGRQALIALQSQDGSWESPTDLGPIGPAMHWIVLRHFDMFSADDAAEAARFLLSEQQDDGSFLPFPGAARSTVAATALCRAGLLACGLPVAHPGVARAQDHVERHGGLASVTTGFRARGDITALFLLVMGLVDATFLPALPPELALTPFDRLVARRVHSGNVMVTLVLCAFVGRYALAEPRGILGSVKRMAENARIRSYLFQWQNEAGDWNGQAIQTWLILLGLAATGLDKSDPRIARAFGWLREMHRRGPNGLTVNAMRTDVWSTAWASLALHAAGEEAAGPILGAAQRSLLRAQVKKPMPRVNQRKAKAARTGGWPFQRGNDLMQDTDDTGLVLATLGTVNGNRLTREAVHATDAALRWLRDMQNPEGGFPAFVWNLPPKPPGPMYLVDVPVELDSPAQALGFL